jgi:Mn2+/Fe2+ NRAMP family transporter
MKRIFAIFLGILTAIGGFVDMGDLVANAATGARFGMGLAWAVVVGVIGIVLFAEMSGRVAAVSHRAVFDLVRERLGARVALANLSASFFITVLTLTAEIAGMAVVIQLVTGLNYLLWLPLAALAVWLVIWRLRFSKMEKLFGLLGLALLVFVVALVHLRPDWSELAHQAAHPAIPPSESLATYFYFAIALFGAAMTPYEVFFFSSGAVEEHWTTKDLSVNRANVYIGFPLGGVLSLALMATAALVLAPRGISADHLSDVMLPTSLSLGKIGLAVLLFGVFWAVSGAALETALSAGYMVSQYFGWQWGKFVKPNDAPRFHLVVIVSILGAAVLGLTAVDPIKVTEYSIVLSAAALPLTYFPILVIANDPAYMGENTNGRILNAIATFYLVILIFVSIVTIPLMIITKAGQ